MCVTTDIYFINFKISTDMKLYTLFHNDDQVVYGTSVNGQAYFFFKGFKSAEQAKEEILSHFKGVERTWHETSLIGEWSEIE